MTRRRALIGTVVVLLLVGVASAAGVWFFFSGHAPGSASIDQAATAFACADPSRTSSASGGDLKGIWNIDAVTG